MLSDVHAKFCSASGHLTVGKVTVVFKGRIISKWCIPKKHKVFRKKIYTLCDMSWCMHKWKGRAGHLQLQKWQQPKLLHTH